MTTADLRSLYAEYFRLPADWGHRAIVAGESTIGAWVQWLSRYRVSESDLRSVFEMYAKAGDHPPTLWQVKRACRGSATGPAPTCDRCQLSGYLYVLVDFGCGHRIVTASYHRQAKSRVGVAVVPCCCDVGSRHLHKGEPALPQWALDRSYHYDQGEACRRDAEAIMSRAPIAEPDPRETEVVPFSAEDEEWLGGADTPREEQP